MTEQEQVWLLAQRIKKAGPAPKLDKTSPDWWRTPRPYDGNNADTVRKVAALDNVPTGEAAREDFFVAKTKARDVDDKDWQKSLNKKWAEKEKNELKAFEDKLSEKVYENLAREGGAI